MRRTFIRFFTIADYEEEENWLREQHRAGWKLVKVIPPLIYVFESCQPQDVVYRLDYKNSQQSLEYMQMARDFGWEHFASCIGWLYFRKPADEAMADGEDELFSDNLSRAEMAEHITRTRLLPLTILFFCCVIPNLINSFSGRFGAISGVFCVIWGVLFAIYVYLLIHCGTKLRAIKDRYRE